MIPLVLSQVQIEGHRIAIAITVTGCSLSVFAALISLLPKNYSSDHYGDLELFHFTGIQTYSEEEYMERVRRALEDDDSLSRYVAYDLYHISTCILQPKFLWIRISYFAFSIGLILGAIFFLLPFLFQW